ncbi:MAG: hypothetical protein R6X32_22395 [Chloroflexota bacterium]
MCGIYGVVDKTTVSREAFIGLGLASKQRGNRTFGYMTAVLSVPAQAPVVRRFIEPFQPQAVQIGAAQVALGHNGTPTGGSGGVLTVTAVHPFASRSLLLAHNGLLLNHEQSGPAGRLPEVDSQLVLTGIQQQLDNDIVIEQAIAQTVSRLEGQQAGWLWYLPTQQLYLWRIMSPLFSLNDRQTFHFSSVRFGPVQNLLSEGIVYRLDPLTLQLTEAATFTFQSPYKT